MDPAAGAEMLPTGDLADALGCPRETLCNALREAGAPRPAQARGRTKLYHLPTVLAWWQARQVSLRMRIGVVIEHCLVMTEAGQTLDASILARERGLHLPAAGKALSEYTARGLLQVIGGTGRAHDPYRYGITDLGRVRLRQARDGTPAAPLLQHYDYGPLVAAWQDPVRRGVPVARESHRWLQGVGHE